MKVPQLSRAHFQLTGRCNLACRFCGQHKGMLAAADEDLPVAKWFSLASELKELAEAAGTRPKIMLWGGEPLLYPGFDELAQMLHHQGFHLSVVTNGTLLDRHLATVAECIDTVNVSVDGFGAAHDAVRGKGVFDRLAANLKRLNPVRKGGLTFLTTISDTNVKGISQLPHQLAELGPDAIVLQPLMYLMGAEIEEYNLYSMKHFGTAYPELAAWRRDDGRAYQEVLEEELALIRQEAYPVPVTFTPHDPAGGAVCSAPWHRIHVRHDGEAGFCTDYFGFSAGNVKTHTLKEIFYGERAERFRAAVQNDALPICRHCPWRKQNF